MPCTIFDLSGPQHSGKTTLAAAIALGQPADVKHVYGVPTRELARLMKRRFPGINAIGQKITGATLGENVRVVVIDDASGRYSDSDIALIAGALTIRHDGLTQLVLIRN